MTQFLPPILLTLFYPREPIPFLPPVKKKTPKGYNGMGKYLDLFEDPEDTPAPVKIYSREEIRNSKREEKLQKSREDLEQRIEEWDPNSDPKIEGDPMKTLFVAHLNYDTTESKLKRELESYGPIKKISIISDVNTGKSRGYAFVEYEHERDMKSAYKRADGKKIDGRRIIVDVERGRTVKNWRPRRLGGGLGAEKRQDIRSDRMEPSERLSRPRSRERNEEKKPRSSSRSSKDHSSSKSRHERSRERESKKESRSSKHSSSSSHRSNPANEDKYRYKDEDRRSKRRRSRSNSPSSSLSAVTDGARNYSYDRNDPYDDSYFRQPKIPKIQSNDVSSNYHSNYYESR